MTWQAITFIVLFAISGTVTLIQHGKDKGKYNFGVWLIAFSIELYLLLSGGFFDKVN